MHRILIILTAFIIIFSCSKKEEPPTPKTQPVPVVTQPAPAPVVKRPTIPNDVHYTIIKTYTRAPVKRTLDVRLNKRVSEKVLRAIALELKAKDSRKYDRTFIDYHIAGNEGSGIAWATSHFNPNLEVNIIGMKVDDDFGPPVCDDPACDVVGVWLDEGMYNSPRRITIYRKKRKVFMETRYRDGSGESKEIIEKMKGIHFKPKKKSEYGNHWIIDNKGNLQVRDKEGLIHTANKF